MSELCQSCNLNLEFIYHSELFCASPGLDRLRPTHISCHLWQHVSLLSHQSILAIVLYDSTARSGPRQGEVYDLAKLLAHTRSKAPEHAAPLKRTQRMRFRPEHYISVS